MGYISVQSVGGAPAAGVVREAGVAVAEAAGEAFGRGAAVILNLVQQEDPRPTVALFAPVELDFDQIAPAVPDSRCNLVAFSPTPVAATPNGEQSYTEAQKETHEFPEI
jgi:hypothetical protein